MGHYFYMTESLFYFILFFGNVSVSTRMSQVAAWRKIMLCRAAQLRAQGPSILPKAWAQGLLWQGRPPPLRDRGEAPLLLAFSELFFSTPCFETGSSVGNSCFLRSAQCKHRVSLFFCVCFQMQMIIHVLGSVFVFLKPNVLKILEIGSSVGLLIAACSWIQLDVIAVQTAGSRGSAHALLLLVLLQLMPQ